MLGFIGAGNMAEAIIKATVNSGFEKAENIIISEKIESRKQHIALSYNLKTASNNVELASYCDVIVLAVKPNVLQFVLDEIKGMVSNKLIISIAAGKNLDFYRSHLGDAAVVRVMPNINAVVGEAISAYCSCFASVEQKAYVESFLMSFGKAVELDERLFSIFSAIGGCSPAFVYMFIDSMARAAVKNGMSKADALAVSAQAVLGSAKMVLESNCHPWELVDRVCSPGGTTIEGVASLEESGFQAAVTKAVEASYNKDKKV